jgi:tripartite-type tricarboxylate transporter receptor subunit TctC
MQFRTMALGFLAAMLAASATAQEQPEAFPSRSLKIVVPFPAGGPSDVLARSVGQKMTEDWGQPVVIENRVGANTVIGAQQVVKAAPDGYTMLMAIDSTLSMNQYLYRNPPYDPLNDFVPITLAAKSMVFMYVNADSPYRSVNDIIAAAKSQPGKLNYGAGTITTQLMGYLFDKTAGTRTVLLKFNGSAQVAQGLLTRSVDFTYDGSAPEMQLVQSGQLRALVKFDRRPFPALSDLPTITAVLPNYEEITVWLGLVAPKGTPMAIIDKLHAEIVKALADPSVRAKAETAGLFVATSTPAEFAAFIRKEANRWSTVVKETGIQYD